MFSGPEGVPLLCSPVVRPKKNSHCSYCGRAFTPKQPWPRVCLCGAVSYQNPLPVVLAVVPVDNGVLAIRRGERPHRGELALPGGFMEFGETWQQALVRELREETRIMLPPEPLSLLDVATAEDGALLVIGQTPPISAEVLPRSCETLEAEELVVLSGGEEMAFQIHAEIVKAVLAGQPS